MTDPTLDAQTDTMTIRERLARAMAGNMYDASIATGEFNRQDYQDVNWQHCLSDVDSILAALNEPSEGMKAASGRIPHARDEEIWQAMLTHIQEGGK